MAAHPIRRTTSHVRSSSWPSTPSTHPLDSRVEALLLKLTAPEVEPSASSATSICNNLKDIKALYEGINTLILCPLNQKVLSLEEQQSGMEKILEGSLALLDASSSINDVMSLMKDSIVELQSCLRRKGGEQAKGLDSYLMSRKNIQKIANKCLKSLHKLNLVKDVNNHNNVSIVKMLREAEIASFSTLKSILAYFSEPASKGKSWSLMSKFMNSKHVSCDREEDVNEIVKMDTAIIGFEAKKMNMDVRMTQELLKQLATLEMSVQEIEGSLESISRCLLRTRVSLLNVISN